MNQAEWALLAAMLAGTTLTCWLASFTRTWGRSAPPVIQSMCGFVVPPVVVASMSSYLATHTIVSHGTTGLVMVGWFLCMVIALSFAWRSTRKVK